MSRIVNAASSRVSATLLIVAAALSVGAALAHGPDHNPLRAQHMMQHGMPHHYHELSNPLQPTAENLAAGASLYRENCALCHGLAGEGDGEAAADLDPPAPSLTKMYSMPMMDMSQGGMGHQMMAGSKHSGMASPGLDSYVFWAISDGGEPLGSAMPAFKDVLSEEERWQIMLFMSNDFGTDESG